MTAHQVFRAPTSSVLVTNQTLINEASAKANGFATAYGPRTSSRSVFLLTKTIASLGSQTESAGNEDAERDKTEPPINKGVAANDLLMRAAKYVTRPSCVDVLIRAGENFMAPQLKNIPHELRNLPRWVTWRAEGAHGEKPRKVPYNPTLPNSRASSTNPDSWGAFAQAEAAYEEGENTGVGIVLNGDGLVGIDIDHCVTNGIVTPAALALLDELGAAYIEISPSVTGLRAFGYSEVLATGCKGKHNGLDVELYSTARFLTITGKAIKSGPIAPLRGAVVK